MTITVSISEEKARFDKNTVYSPENINYISNCSNTFAQTKCGKLNIVQIVLCLLSLALVRPYKRGGDIEFFFILIIFHASLLTAVILWDNLNGQKLRKMLRLEGADRYYYGALALLCYIVSFLMAVCNLGYYSPWINISAAMLGMLTALTYGYCWWLFFNERSIN